MKRLDFRKLGKDLEELGWTTSCREDNQYVRWYMYTGRDEAKNPIWFNVKQFPNRGNELLPLLTVKMESTYLFDDTLKAIMILKGHLDGCREDGEYISKDGDYHI